MQLDGFASWFLVIFYVIASLTLAALVGAVAFLIWKLNTILERYEAKVEPTLQKADVVLALLAEKTESIGGKAEHLLAQSGEMAESVHERVDRTAVTVQRTINEPIIRINSLAAALSQGMATFSRLQRGALVKNGTPATAVTVTEVAETEVAETEVAETEVAETAELAVEAPVVVEISSPVAATAATTAVQNITEKPAAESETVLVGRKN